jgi:hypothetical protein
MSTSLPPQQPQINDQKTQLGGKTTIFTPLFNWWTITRQVRQSRQM